MKKKYKIILNVILLLIIIVVIGFIGSYFLKNKPHDLPKTIDVITNFNYSLEKRDTAYMKKTYEELKEVLNNKNINMENYAKLLTKLFVIDLFTLANKTNSLDVGGANYVYPKALDNFKLNVSSTLYKIIENDYEGKRSQELPIVKEVQIKDFKASKYKIDNQEEYDAYEIKINIAYEKDLGYDKYAKVTSIIKEGKIYIVEYLSKE